MATHLKLLRYRVTDKSTSGILLINGLFQCFTLEDAPKDHKIKGETAIPAGFYEVGIKTQNTPLTKKYAARHSFFKRHIEIKSVPGFTSVYLHVGNNPGDTAGCVLVGDAAFNNQVGSSRLAYEKLYSLLYPLLEDKKHVSIEICYP